MNEIKISVRSLVEFLLREGDIDNRLPRVSEQAMLEGGRIHRKIQKLMGPHYQAEVPLQYRENCGDYYLTIDGRADGILEEENELPLIDEIKGTYRDVNRMKEPVRVHLAQAKCYAAIYCMKEDTAGATVQMTYCNMDTEEIKRFSFPYTANELIGWFNDLIMAYRKWTDFSVRWRARRNASIAEASFPFDYRAGQRDLVAGVYRTITQEKKLFLMAPTGSGKTIATIFPSVKAIGEAKAERLFYLTAKTITRGVAEETFAILRDQEALSFKTVTITAKDKACILDKADCNPEACPYAKGHFDRINDAVYDLLTHEDAMTRDVIRAYADRYRVCPFEMALDLSLFADGVICDYNYAFDPFVYLKRFFAEGGDRENLFLVDEAHNLLERGREMYSAILTREDFLLMAETVSPFHKKIEKHIRKCVKAFDALENAAYPYRFVKKNGTDEEMVAWERSVEAAEASGYRRITDNGVTLPEIDALLHSLIRLQTILSEYLEDHKKGPVRDQILTFYFTVGSFLTIYELVDVRYEVYASWDKTQTMERFHVHLYCIDPGENLRQCMKRAVSTILFSATFLPIQYYKKLLGGTEEDYEIYAKSAFNPDKLSVFIASDVTSRYTQRGEDQYYRIAAHIEEVTMARPGNYMVFFPSYAFARAVYEAYEELFLDEGEAEVLLQEDYVTEEAREAFLARFEPAIVPVPLAGSRLIGFCVLGGAFAEGIDLQGDALIGAIVVGTGLPMVGNERQIIRTYFDGHGESGWDYAYRFPGMCKVLQAAGRVIRTDADTGVVVLLDDRFLQRGYSALFPREWKQISVISTASVRNSVNAFWERISEDSDSTD